MRRYIVILTVLTLSATLATFALPHIGQAARKAPSRPAGTLFPGTPTPCRTPGYWTIVPSPNVANLYNVLTGVATISPTNVIAVGNTNTTYNSLMSASPLIEQWNGSSWQIVSSPASSGAFNAVAADSATDIWVVGQSPAPSPYFPMYQTLIAHWNGSSWSIIPSPNVANESNVLNGVAVINPNDVWAVGSASVISPNSGQATSTQTLTEHWNGNSWRIISSRNPVSNFDFLKGVTAVSSTDVWAVGGTVSSTIGVGAGALAEHWDGSSWNVISVLPLYHETDTFTAVAHSGGVIMAVGTLYTFDDTPQTFVAASEDDIYATFGAVSSQDVPNANDTLAGVAPITTRQFVAVGQSNYSTLALQDAVNEYAIGHTQNASQFGDALNGIAAVSTTSMWAVGMSVTAQGVYQTLIEQYHPNLQSGIPCPWQ